MKSSVNLENPENLLVYMTPGVYQILCSANNTVYIGVTQNILERFGKHSATLAAKPISMIADLYKRIGTISVRRILHLL